MGGRSEGGSAKVVGSEIARRAHIDEARCRWMYVIENGGEGKRGWREEEVEKKGRRGRES